MSKTNYKRLGDYIREVDVRNRDLKVTKLLGVSISKEFMPSIANTIGTDMSSYKVVEPRQFAYGPVTSRNGDKVSIALYKDGEKAIVSQAYTIFEVTNKLELLPEYLMMWFRRPEFDRYARFKSHGSAREIFNWEEMCDVELPIPPIDQQRKIVAEYNAIQQRIKLNEQLIVKLEETAQAIYRKMFVDGIDKNNLPEGWRMGQVKNFGVVVTGKTPSTLDEDNFGEYMPFVTIPDMHKNIFIYKTERMLSRKGVNTQKKKTLPLNSICVSCIGTPGLVSITTVKCQTNQQINSIVINDANNLYYLYLALKDLQKVIAEYGIGGAVLNNLNKNDFENLNILIPKEHDLAMFQSKIQCIFNLIRLKQDEQMKLHKLHFLILAKIIY